MKLTILLSLLSLATLSANENAIDLSGTWKLQLDTKDEMLQKAPKAWKFSDTIKLPNTTAKAGKAPKLNIKPTLVDPWVRTLKQHHPYTGVAWYQKKVMIAADWENKDIIFKLERALWESRVWINGKPAGDPQLSLSVPHRYDLGNLLKPGR